MKPNTFKVFEGGIEFCHYGPASWKTGKLVWSTVTRFSPFLANSTDAEKSKRIRGFQERGYKRVFSPENKPA